MSASTTEGIREQEEVAEEAPADLEPPWPSQKLRMLIIVNPYATTVSDRLRHLVVYALQGRFEVDAVDTEDRGHATEICREAAHEGYDVVVAFGGDGTVNEAANGLLGSSTPLCCLPGGSANVFGRMLGIPGELVDATEHVLALADHWRVRKVDLGVANGRCFTFASGSTRAWSSASTRTLAARRASAPTTSPQSRWPRSCAVTWSIRRASRCAPPRARSRASPRSSRTARRSRTSRTVRSTSPRAP